MPRSVREASEGVETSRETQRTQVQVAPDRLIKSFKDCKVHALKCNVSIFAGSFCERQVRQP